MLWKTNKSNMMIFSELMEWLALLKELPKQKDLLMKEIILSINAQEKL